MQGGPIKLSTELTVSNDYFKKAYNFVEGNTIFAKICQAMS